MAKLDEKQFIIPFVGLKQGRHEFQFDLTDTFFETFEYSIIQNGKVHIDFTFDKKDTMMVGEFEIEGSVITGCDRCNDPIEIPIEGEFRLVYKFDTEESEDESLVVIYPEEYELNIKESLLEFITVSLPSRTVHPEGECNEEMLKYLSEYVVNSLDDDDDDDFDDDDLDEDEYDDDDFDDDEDDDDDDFEDDDDDDEPSDKPIDPRWAALSNFSNN